MLLLVVAALMAYQCIFLALQPPPSQKDWAGIVSRLCVLIVCVCIDQLVIKQEDVVMRRTALEVIRAFTGRDSSKPLS